jgi:hypothetical protein
MCVYIVVGGHAKKYFMKIIGLLLTIITTNIFGQNIEVPSDLKKENILIELNSFEKTVELTNKEFERSNDKDKCEKRKKEILETKTPNNRNEIGDTYAVAIPYNVVDWVNETIIKSFKKDKEKQYTLVNEQTLDNFPMDKWRYVLRYKYIFKAGDPLETRLLFYFFDRQKNIDLVNYDATDSLKVFRPVMFYTADKMYPFYDMIRIYSVKKEFESFFKQL